jgi:diguanylate cyclase (GGDEF)-like protein
MLVIAVVVAVAVGMFVSRLISEREAIEVRDALSRTTQAIDARLGQTMAVSADWGVWDDTYRFVRDGNQDYVATNLESTTLGLISLDFMVFLDVSGKPRYVLAGQGSSVTRNVMPPGLSAYLATHPLLVRPPRSGTAGVVPLTAGIALVSSQEVLRSSGKGPTDGTVVVGRYVDGKERAAIERVIGAPVQLSSEASAGLSAASAAAWNKLAAGAEFVDMPLGGQTQAGDAFIRGIDGKPVALLEVVLPRTTAILMRQSTGLFIAGAIAALLAFVIIVVETVDRLVLKRVARLSDDVRQVGMNGDFGARVEAQGRDELTALADDINWMLSSLQNSEQEMAYLATHDVLTGLTNRRLFEDELARELSENRRLGQRGAVLWLDLDHFKDVNDSLGHAVGDELLRQFAALLRSKTRRYATLARLGGDEFAMIIPHADETEAIATANRIIGMLASSVFEIGHHQLTTGASIGVALYPEHGALAGELLPCADLAMYHAKSEGRGRAAVYRPEWQDEIVSRAESIERIRAALRDDRFVLHAQPIVGVAGDGLDSYELLLRMVDLDGTLIPPGDFLPAAEYLGLMAEVDHWVVRRGIEMLAEEQAAGRRTRFSLNLSGSAFTDPELPETIRRLLADADVPPSRLTFEITETTAISDITTARRFVDALRAIGCRFAIDDFGSGTASFLYLKHLHIDYLKIDGSIITKLQGVSSDAYFVKAIVDMCKGLGIETVAEYIENEQLLDMVRQSGVDFAQGFYIGRPGPLGTWTDSRSLREPVAQAGVR